ncbi:MAG TPA: ABC transporter permease [Jiangellales bacterium]|nr:ABC transporter permease [Jiangellales bacterium]
MTLTQARPAAETRRARRTALGWFRDHIVLIAGLLALAYLLIPNVVVVVLSFNRPAGRFNYTWNEFSLNAWANPCDVAGMCDALGVSLRIAVLSTLVAAALGTLAAFALTRHRFRGRGGTNVLIFFPMATPEVVMGSSLLALFVNAAIVPLGFWTILIAHIMFMLSYVIVTVKARLAVLDPRLEEAAMDLYADERTTFWRVTFPLALPGIAAASLLAFALSFDDFIITNFNAGSEVTFPMFVWGAAQRGAPPQVNVIGTMMFIAALAAVLIGQLAGRRGRAR